ncbi:hypothetical protein BDA96_07G224500 [Sorghum bicolor]|uniref:Uncharacterized protein n=1 Tax=Sorghum bicolor TaxID=4558 RepID=A0A921UA89_SORBI|nr:hypothetical protein BDA96_07G224500 [Sorghum bicolor]
MTTFSLLLFSNSNTIPIMFVTDCALTSLSLIGSRFSSCHTLRASLHFSKRSRHLHQTCCTCNI